MPQDYSARFPSNPAHLAAIRQFVRDKARELGFTDGELEAIVLAVDEACANVMEHAYAPGQTEPGLDLCVKIEYDRCTIVIADQGAPFDPDRWVPPDLGEYLAQLRVGGLGVYLMRTLMDRVDYHTQPGGKNEVRLTKFRMGPPS